MVTLAESAGRAPARSMQVGTGGVCHSSWGAVPVGCSAQSGGDWAAHYKRDGDTGQSCINTQYQLVCPVPGNVNIFY